mmetsp:Transcript_80813/g.228737  ORF Transcript_80813/g.228737 Transcript_80813/m.228737 type:complete len:227 (-) Transcript_80813:181-861(-)
MSCIFSNQELAAAALRVQTSSRAHSMFSRVDEARNSMVPSPAGAQRSSCQRRPMLETVPSSLSSTLWSLRGRPFIATSVPRIVICAPPLPSHSPCSTSSVMGPLACLGAGAGHLGALPPMQMKPSSMTGVPAGLAFGSAAQACGAAGRASGGQMGALVPAQMKPSSATGVPAGREDAHFSRPCCGPAAPCACSCVPSSWASPLRTSTLSRANQSTSGVSPSEKASL